MSLKQHQYKLQFAWILSCNCVLCFFWNVYGHCTP